MRIQSPREEIVLLLAEPKHSFIDTGCSFAGHRVYLEGTGDTKRDQKLAKYYAEWIANRTSSLSYRRPL